MAFEARSGRETASAAESPQAVTPEGAASWQTRKRLPLGSSPRRLSFDRRLGLWVAGLVLPWVVGAGIATWAATTSMGSALGVTALAATFAGVLLSVLFEQITRPLQTLSNVVAALSEDDFSFRARGGRRDDSLGDLALEVNALASTLQTQRNTARDALTLAERVMAAMQTPVLAFSAEGNLRLLNAAAEISLGLPRAECVGKTAAALHLAPLLQLPDGTTHTHRSATGEVRWVLRRSSFRLAGLPHTLVVLSDVDAALREEERVAWQRLIRVLSHEINNSLTPITSVAGSLRVSLPVLSPGVGDAVLAGDVLAGLRRGLTLIEDRAFSLHRFLQGYQQLTRLPRPVQQQVSLQALVARVVALESRVPVEMLPGPAVLINVDAAQIEQLLINLLRNAAEAALLVPTTGVKPRVWLEWEVLDRELFLRVQDNGPGLSDLANLFVPFYTTKPGGSGIGLVLAQQIAQAHQGSLTLSNRGDGPGCVAELRLPVIP